MVQHMVNKKIIAHEIGHALVGRLFDKEYDPDYLLLEGEKGSIAACYFLQERTSIPPYPGLKNISDLGGMFGELLYCGCWWPWGARADLDNISYEGNNKLVKEVDEWLWNSNKKNSFFGLIKNKTRLERRRIKCDKVYTVKYLPNIWNEYCKFINFIDKKEFLLVIDEIYNEKECIIHNKKLCEIMDRIML